MKKQSILLILTIFMSVFIFTQCNCTKKTFQKTPPFTITEAHYQDWIGGQPGVSGTSVYINLSAIAKNVIPDSLFFRQSKTKVDIKNAEEGYLWVANFNTNSDRDRNRNMHIEPSEEYGNKPPMIESIPFELAEGDAVMSYYTKGKLAYFKLSDLEKKETLFFPTARPER